MIKKHEHQAEATRAAVRSSHQHQNVYRLDRITSTAKREERNRLLLKMHHLQVNVSSTQSCVKSESRAATDLEMNRRPQPVNQTWRTEAKVDSWKVFAFTFMSVFSHTQKNLPILLSMLHHNRVRSFNPVIIYHWLAGHRRTVNTGGKTVNWTNSGRWYLAARIAFLLSADAGRLKRSALFCNLCFKKRL